MRHTLVMSADCPCPTVRESNIYHKSIHKLIHNITP
jgi:hypothetical protein